MVEHWLPAPETEQREVVGPRADKRGPAPIRPEGDGVRASRAESTLKGERMASDQPEARAEADAQIGLIQWLILRNDSLRAGVASRAVLVMTADGILLGLLGIAAAGVFPLLAGLGRVERGAVLLVALAAAGPLLASLTSAAGGALDAWRTGRSLAGLTKGDGLFFNARATIERFDSASSFGNAFVHARSEDLRNWALAELWQAQVLYRHRYERLRQATKRLYFGVVAILALAFTSVAWSLLH
jgi:hypothetical protein